MHVHMFPLAAGFKFMSNFTVHPFTILFSPFFLSTCMGYFPVITGKFPLFRVVQQLARCETARKFNCYFLEMRQLL